MSTEVIHWDASSCDWDGQRFSISVPHVASLWAARSLRVNLGKRLLRIRELEQASVAVVEAVWESGDIERWGELIISGIEVWPDPVVLRNEVELALAEAYAAAERAKQEAESFNQAMRRDVGPA
jgi:hypothetical protein